MNERHQNYQEIPHIEVYPNFAVEEGEVVPAENFKELPVSDEGSLDEQLDAEVDIHVAQELQAEADAKAAQEKLEKEYDDQLESEASKLGGNGEAYDRARSLLESKGIVPPPAPVPVEIGANALKTVWLNEALEKANAIQDPEERKKARNEILAKHRAKLEIGERRSGPISRKKSH